MQCVILAAGYATRLYPLTENFPKPLLEVGSKSILNRLLENAAETGKIDRFLVISNHKFAGIFEEWAAKNEFFFGEKKIPVEVLDDGTSTNETRLGAVKDLQLAMETYQIQDDLLVLAGDNLLDFSLEGFLDFAQQKKASCVMVHEEHELEKQRRTAIVTFDEDHRIDSYEEKPREPKGIHAVPPFYCYRWEDARRIEEALADGCNADAPGSFAAWLSKKAPLYAYEMPGERIDIGNLESLEQARKRFG